MVIVTWSAIACGYPGAGVYMGLAPADEHLVVARGLGPKQARLFVGGRMSASGASRSIHYYAVRDPSGVRVIPVDPRTHENREHVHLRFELRPNGNGESLRLVTPAAADGPQFGFVVSIGLPLQDEPSFFERVLGNGPVRDWDDLFARLDCAERRARPPGAKTGRKAS